jgi:hypothetical protein
MKAKRGRPTVYTQAIADEICTRLAEGESLRDICSESRMPPESTVREWVDDDRGGDENGPGFAARYARARQHGYQRLADELIAISDADYTGPGGLVDNGAIQQARLKSDNRKWLLSKMLPKQFGDKVTQEITGDPNAPLVTRIELVPIVPQARLPKPEDDETVCVSEAAITPLKVAAFR